MDRQKAVDILKALLNNEVCPLSFVSIDKDDYGFYIILRGVNDGDKIRAFLAEENVVLYQNKAEDYCIIYEP